jgi:hypothetical protein
MTTYVMYGGYRLFDDVRDCEWTEELEDDLYTGHCPKVGQICMLRGCTEYEADTICIGQILARVEHDRVCEFHDVNLDHFRRGDIQTMIRLRATGGGEDFFPLRVFVFSVFD